MMILLLFFLAGTAVGSFLNVVADRLPAGRSIVSPPSCCPGCHRRIAKRDLVPVFSFLRLKGHCRYCQAAIPVRSFIIELFTGSLFAFLVWYSGLSYELLIILIYTCFFIVLAITDLEQGILPDKIVYAGMIAAFMVALAGSIAGFEPAYAGGTALRFSGLWILNAVIGGAAGFIILFLVALVSRGGMGGGDIKLAGFMGLATGFPLILVTIFLAVIVGGLVSILLLVFKIKRRDEAIPFGHFLALAALVTLLWGNPLLGWYLAAGKFAVTWHLFFL
jgi:leader peptidase (prepilin peptidase)/N-methyltransferase